ncbi:MAG: DUF4279 domain-containing protein [Erysipelotrichaceae bacterium]|jgi:hypothetical protein|nr:DUF4279 domain-containing protein [Erysipelotrichaceae bacterium]
MSAKIPHNECYTYFAIDGNFDPELITKRLGLRPSYTHRIGDQDTRLGNEYIWPVWQYGMYRKYDNCINNMLMKTIEDLLPKVELLQSLKAEFDLKYFLRVVLTVYPYNVSPDLSPGAEVISFLYHTGTQFSVDHYCQDPFEVKREGNGMEEIWEALKMHNKANQKNNS